MTRTDTDDADAAPESIAAFRQRVADAAERADRLADAGPYDPEWESLERHDEAPAWFRDAKFGIYCHWGVYSVPAFNSEWYPRWMYMADPTAAEVDWGDEVHPHHVETYGEPDEFPYQAFVPEFTAEQFDPEAWADLFEAAGARFAGPAAEHSDGWSNWDSAVNPWNAADRGPERDLVGELESAIRDRGLRFLTSFHHSSRPEYFEFATEQYPSVTEGFPDQVMYGALEDDLRYGLWLAKLVEVVEGYEPDLLWHDSKLGRIPEEYHRRYLAAFLGDAAADDRDVVVTAKDEDFPPSVAVEDFERGRPADRRERPWLTDASVTRGSWSHTEDLELRSTRELLHELIDVVSKNGCLLLNVAPRADGTIPEDQRSLLRGIGAWLETHGEAIYGTRPWTTFGHGPTRLAEGGHFVDDVEYTPEDVRYTRSADGETLYALVMGWPEGELVLEGAAVESDTDEGPAAPAVDLLGSDERVRWTVTDENRLAVTAPELEPAERPSDAAVAFAITGVDPTADVEST